MSGSVICAINPSRTAAVRTREDVDGEDFGAGADSTSICWFTSPSRRTRTPTIDQVPRA